MAKKPTDANLDRFNELKVALKIDEDDLDRMLVEQPELFHEVADQHALAISRRDRAKASMDQVSADLYLGIRKQGAKQKGDKPSETAIKQMIEIDSDFQAAQSEYLTLKRWTDRWEGLRTGFKDRSYMLRELSSAATGRMYMDGSGGKQKRSAEGNIAERNKEEAGELRHRKRPRPRNDNEDEDE